MASLTVKSASEIRDDILRVIRAGLIRIGVPNPNVTPGSDWYVLATAVGNEIEVVGANVQVALDAQMPDTATGAALERVASLFFGSSPRRGAAGSHGNVTFNASASSTIIVGTTLIDGAGLRYQVSVQGTYADGDLIPITAIDTGEGTNHLSGDVLQWVVPPTYSAQTAIVAAGGLTGGHPLEDDPTLLARLLDYLRNPPGNGNWSQIAGLAEEASTVVQKAFVYPAANGPATCHVAVVGYATSTSKNRDIDTPTVTNVILPFITAALPEYVEIVATSVTDYNTDVAFAISIPAAKTAVPAGPGGGWVNGTPWPVPASGTGYAEVASVTSTTQFTITTGSACPVPLDGVTQIAWLSTADWLLYTGTVLSHSGTAPTYTVTIDTPFVNIASGEFIWPNAVNAQTYVNAVLAQFAAMGPGEKTSNAGRLPRAYRHPIPAQSWPYSMTAGMLRALVASGEEVLDASYLYRGMTTPPVPGLITSAPGILVPRRLALYPST